MLLFLAENIRASPDLQGGGEHPGNQRGASSAIALPPELSRKLAQGMAAPRYRSADLKPRQLPASMLTGL